jgi:hypothetical protein
MIQTISPGALPPTDHPMDASAPAAPDTAQPGPSAHGMASGSADALATFNARFGVPAQVLALYADKNGAGGSRASKAAPKADPLVGAELPGQKGVVVQRTLGDVAGYATKNHALAWARAMGSERAMVVLGKDKRWHAVETNVVAKDASGGTGRVATAVQVGKVDIAEYNRLKGEAMKANDPAKWKTFAAYALGLPESEIEILRKGDTPSSTKVNINLSPDFNPEGRTAGFDPKQPAWVQLGPKAFNRPANAVATLAHEEVHAEHRRQTGELYATYQASHSTKRFRDWAAENVKDVRRVDIVAGYEDGTTAPTELEAHVEAARVAFASGDLAQARTDLTKVATLPILPLLQTQLPSIEALKKLRDSLPADQRDVFKEVAGKAKSGSVLKGL